MRRRNRNDQLVTARFLRRPRARPSGTTPLVSTVWDLRMINAAVARAPSRTVRQRPHPTTRPWSASSSTAETTRTTSSSPPTRRQLQRLRLPCAAASRCPTSAQPGGCWRSTRIAPTAAPSASIPRARASELCSTPASSRSSPTSARLSIPLNGINDYNNPAKKKPPQLFSHNDQQVQWQTSIPDQQSRTGWGGRCADLLYSMNGDSTVSMSMSLAGANTLEVGNVVNAVRHRHQRHHRPDQPHARTHPGACKDLLVMPHPNLYEAAFATVTNTALDQQRPVTTARSTRATDASPPSSPTPALGNQLKMIARLISAHRASTTTDRSSSLRRRV